MDLFEKASRLKIRFSTSKGLIGVEDLWDLPLTATANRPNLDDVARELDAALKAGTQVSFVTGASDVDEHLKLAFDIVIHVINTKISERDTAKKDADIRAQKQRIMALIDQKKDAALSEASIDELQRMLQSL